MSWCFPPFAIHLTKPVNLSLVNERKLGPRLSVLRRIGRDGRKADMALADSGAAFEEA